MSLLPVRLPENVEALSAGGIALDVPSISKAKTCGEVFAYFSENMEFPALAITDESARVVGLVSRLIFVARYAKQYSPELYSKKTILTLANAYPLLIDEDASITQVGELLAAHPSALTESFVVTSKGLYKGLGTTDAVMRAKLLLLQLRERDLGLALGHAKEADEAKSNFLALMSHELRTPLNAIIGFSDLICSEMYGPIGSARYADYLNDINGAGKHLLALINDILDLSKAESGKLDLCCEVVDASQLTGDCVRLIRQRAIDAGVRLTDTVDTGLGVFLDRLRMKQILLNLLSNAIKFTPKGGAVSVSSEVEPDGCITLSVGDTGIGMAPEMIPLALEPFRQIESPMSRNVEGTGLGLSLVKTLAEAHQVVLGIESAPGKGTRFHCDFRLCVVT